MRGKGFVGKPIAQDGPLVGGCLPHLQGADADDAVGGLL